VFGVTLSSYVLSFYYVLSFLSLGVVVLLTFLLTFEVSFTIRSSYSYVLLTSYLVGRSTRILKESVLRSIAIGSLGSL